MAWVSFMEPFPMAPKWRTSTTAEPIDTLGVGVHQLVAEAGRITTDNASDAADAKTLRLNLRRMDTPEYGKTDPCAPLSADLIFTPEIASLCEWRGKGASFASGYANVQIWPGFKFVKWRQAHGVFSD